ncbi:hypothetical protein [Vibrio sinaloensis]|uniref:RiboL-PSP-HEPN domain-containing protein n=1 Tax=Photobacterium sp. (strain ATCC 43367) TaxID=379097 RepID=A0A0A5HTC6_PHOS4|nr:hypothetical protein [Vibrio sinaloensis]KGY06781.1 hypothetical protein NM06_20675 [Vibrio sinaloensis]
MSPDETYKLFISGVPPMAVFNMHSAEILDLVNNDDESEENILKLVPTLSLIGLIAYFESYCKESASAIINIHPDLLEKAQAAGFDTTINCAELKSFNYDISGRLGSLVVEKYNFGDVKKVNSFWGALFKSTPLSKDEVKKFAKLLADRNLFVHHGGIYTSKYIKQYMKDLDMSAHAHYHSVEYNHEDFRNHYKFIHKLVEKIADCTVVGLNKCIEDGELDRTELIEKAIEQLAWD